MMDTDKYPYQLEEENVAELAGVMVGNYFLLECLGREGMVETYRARPTTRGGYDVALRLFRPQFPDPTGFHDHFAAEVEKVWRCHHDHIQPLLEFGSGAGLLYSVTQWSELETLEQLIERQQGNMLPLHLVLRFVTQLCSAVQFAHEQGIVHGNIQPSSILVRDVAPICSTNAAGAANPGQLAHDASASTASQSGKLQGVRASLSGGTQGEEHILLTNFSMKRAHQEDEPVVAQIEEGNPRYIAPEQAISMLCPASDIYAIGVLLFRLLGGQLPYEGESVAEIAMKHANEPIPSLHVLRPELPEALELVVRVALAKTPEARFPDATALAQALLLAVMPENAAFVSIAPQRRIEVQSRRTPFTWTRALSLLTLTVLLFGLAGSLFFISSFPKHIGELTGFPFGSAGQSGVTLHTPGSGSSTVTTTSPPQNGNSTPPGNGQGPISGIGPGSKGHKTPVPSRGTPVVGGPIPTSPVGTPAPNPTPVNCVSGTLSIDGSPNLEPLLQQINNDYQALCPGTSISQNQGGSRAALNNLQRGLIDIAASDLTAKLSRNLSDHPMVALMYAVIVNPDVQVSDLSSSTLQGIYSGQITNWSQIGGPDEAITVILHPPNDTAAAIFRAYVLNGMPEHLNGIKEKKNLPNLLTQAVAQTPGAISYVPLIAAQNTNVSVLSIDGVYPGIQSLLDGTYSFWSVEHLYTAGASSALAQAYMQFLSSNQEASIFNQFNAVPITTLPQNTLNSHLPGPEI